MMHRQSGAMTIICLIGGFLIACISALLQN